MNLVKTIREILLNYQVVKLDNINMNQTIDNIPDEFIPAKMLNVKKTDINLYDDII